MRTLKNKSLTAYIFCCLFLAYGGFLSNRWNNNWSNGVLSWDVSGYYLYLPAFFYDDLGKIHQRDYIIQKYHPGGNELAAYPCSNGNNIMKY